jgi:1,4-dihydroxy-2-naphthoate polyprenyltransferase
LTFRQLLGVVELRTKIVSLSTLACATLYAWRETGRADLPTLALTLPAVLLVDMGTTAFNSFFDHWRGVDRSPRLREADKVLVTEGVPALAALLVAAACYFAAAALGIALAFREGAWAIGAGALCLAAGFLYNGGPRPISRSPFGELVAGAFLGTALFVIAYRLQAGSWGPRPTLASLPCALFIASILAVNNACDIEGDREAGRRTLAIVLGPAAAAFIPPALGVCAFAATLVLAAAGILPSASAAAAALAAAASVPLYAGMLRAGFSHGTKSASMRRILGAFSLWSLGFVAGILVAFAAA